MLHFYVFKQKSLHHRNCGCVDCLQFSLEKVLLFNVVTSRLRSDFFMNKYCYHDDRSPRFSVGGGDEMMSRRVLNNSKPLFFSNKSEKKRRQH